MIICFTLFTGHGDSNSKNLPTKVKDLPPVGQVSCGSAHTLVVSRDNKTVWSLICFTLYTGHGDSNSKNLPTKVKDLPLVGQVSCGSAHTLVVSRDNKTVW